MKTIQEIDGLLNKYKSFSFETVFNKQRMFEVYSNYALNISDKKINIGFETIDKGMNGIRPSELMTVIAGTNIGKSAFAMNIMYNVSQTSNGLIILFSLEMSETDIFERYIQMQMNLNTYQVEQIFARKNEAELSKIKELIQKHNNIISIIKRVKIEEISQYVLAIEEMEKKECTFVIVDHLGLIQNEKYKDDYSKTTNNMMQLKEIALHLKKPIMLLSQTSRADIKSDSGLTLHSGKNSGEVENSSQIVFTLQQVKDIEVGKFDIVTVEKLQSKELSLLKLKCEKKKRGDYSDTEILFDKKNLRMYEYEKYLSKVARQESVF